MNIKEFSKIGVPVSTISKALVTIKTLMQKQKNY